MKIKAFVLTMILPAWMLIGCGQLETNETTAGNAAQGLLSEGVITEEDASSLNNDLLEENLELSETSPNSMLMKLGGAELLIDFIKNLSGDPEEIAMVINGVEVTTEVATNPESLQGLVASLVSSQLEGREIFGMPLTDLVEMGLGLITGDTEQADFSNVFGTLVRGALGMFVNNSPVGSIISTLLGPALEGAVGEDPNANSGPSNNNNNNNNSNETPRGNIVNTIGGALTGGSGEGALGGIFSLIMNLFK
jgi:hypothetical protein